MEPEAAVLASLRRAVEAMPDDAGLRLHLAGLLLDAGLREEAIRHLGALVHADPGNAAALRLLLRASGEPGGTGKPGGTAAGPGGDGAAGGPSGGPVPAPLADAAPGGAAAAGGPARQPGGPAPGGPASDGTGAGGAGGSTGRRPRRSSPGACRPCSSPPGQPRTRAR